MLTKVEVVTEQNATLELPLEDVVDGYVIQDITGLDPVKATIVSSSFARLDGEQYQSSRRDLRNIVITLGLEPDYVETTVRALRKRLYDYLMPKSTVTLRFYVEGEEAVEILGRVESFDSPIFTKEPTATVSILCLDPDFKALEPVLFEGVTNAVGDETLLEYLGTVETGFSFGIYPDRPINSFTINHRAGDDMFTSLDFVTPLQAGDILTISTVTGSKGAHLSRTTQGVTFEGSILYGIAPHSSWINLFPGPNYIRVSAEGLGIPYSLSYTHKFGGL